MERRLQNVTGTITGKFYVDGVLTDPSPATATVEILRADGTVLVTAGTAAPRQSVGVFGFALSAGQAGTLDRLTARWTSANLGTVTTTVEIVGGFLCSLSELGEVVTGKTSEQLQVIRVQLEQRLEKALGYACVPRYALESKAIRNGRVATRLPLRVIRSLSVAGSAYSAGQIAALHLTNSSVYGMWASGLVTIGYEHGRDFPDEDISRAMLLAADEVYGAQAVGVGAPVVSQEADNMSVTYGAYLVAKSPFVGSELNAIIRANALPAIA